MAIKQYILMRIDLKEMGKGKMVTQGAHASVKCIENIINNRIGAESTNFAEYLFLGNNGQQAKETDDQLKEGYSGQFVGRTVILERWKRWYQEWNESFYKKITVKVATLDELFHYARMAFIYKLPVFVVKDKGLTQIPEDTYTACAVLLDDMMGWNGMFNSLKLL